MLADSSIVYTLLRNGWYSENYLASAPAALEHGVFIGAAGDGKNRLSNAGRLCGSCGTRD